MSFFGRFLSKPLYRLRTGTSFFDNARPLSKPHLNDKVLIWGHADACVPYPYYFGCAGKTVRRRLAFYLEHNMFSKREEGNPCKEISF